MEFSVHNNDSRVCNRKSKVHQFYRQLGRSISRLYRDPKNGQDDIEDAESSIQHPVSSIFSFIIILVLFLNIGSGLADDPGITKVRLMQKNDSTYVIEADISQALLWAIKPPIFPDRFQVSDLEYITESGWIIVQSTAITRGEPLSDQDQLLLPWMRNGVSITVQWLDGSIHQGLFLRSLEGIYIPVALIKPSTRSFADICLDQFVLGIEHLSFKGIHLFLIAALALLFPSRQLFRALLYYTIGQAISLILIDFDIPGMDLLFIDILIVITVFILSYAYFDKAKVSKYLPILSLLGILHGLSYQQEIAILDLQSQYILPAVFMFNIAIDVGQFFAAGVFLLLFHLLKKIKNIKKTIAYWFGSLAIVLILSIFSREVSGGKTDILKIEGLPNATQFSLPVTQMNQTGGKKQAGARQLTSPVMLYLSVEPYEVRQEILIQARAAVQFLGLDDRGKGSIPIESLDPVKNEILNVIKNENEVIIDDLISEPILTRSEFVTLGAAGVIQRSDPIPESLDHGILGITLVYPSPELANDVRIGWTLFSDLVQKIEATTTDPFGGTTEVLSADKSELHWKSRLTGYRVPAIEQIKVEQPEFPIFSIVLFVSVILIFIVGPKGKILLRRPVLLSIIGIGFLFYPFLRIPIEIPFIGHWKPSAERSTVILKGLLTNVYRSFELRDENDLYDRLAVSVIGDQLTKIYLENRKSLEFENRGGARARVEEVVINTVDDVRRAENGNFQAEVQWTVSGSVSHFGHTHYRQNRYHAIITFMIDANSWKIKNIEILDERRLL